MGTRGKEKDLEKGLSTPERTLKLSGMDRSIMPWPRLDVAWLWMVWWFQTHFFPFTYLIFLPFLHILCMDGVFILVRLDQGFGRSRNIVLGLRPDWCWSTSVCSGGIH